MPELILFSPVWAERFVQAWNAQTQPGKTGVKSTQALAFELTQAGTTLSLCVLDWDAQGLVTLSTQTPVRRFEAEQAAWQDLMRQRLKAVPSVMSGRIRYHGDFAFLIRLGLSFDQVARVAASVDTTEPASGLASP